MHVGILPNYWQCYSSTRTTCSKLIRQPLYFMVALEGHTRRKYWRQISWKISRLSPMLRNVMSATSPVRETWRQILCLRLHPMAQKGHQRFLFYFIFLFYLPTDAAELCWIQFNSIQHDIYFIHLWTRKGMSEYDKQITITCAHSDENKVIKWKPKIGNTSMYNIKWEYEAVRVS